MRLLLPLLFVAAAAPSVLGQGEECQDGDNPFAECDGCDGQIFLNSDCTQAFQCLNDVDHPGVNDGCFYECEGEYDIMIPDFAGNFFECIDNSDGAIRCPGQTKIHCEDDPVEDPLTSDVCDCEGQLWVSPDCRTGFNCRSRFPGGGVSITCLDDEIISIDAQNWQWSCQPDNGNCPGGGGFSLGCSEGPIAVPTDCVPYSFNPFGNCDGCDGQVYMNSGCTQAFQCIDSQEFPDENDGCLYQCDENQIMVPDFANNLFKCLDNENEQARCPGQFKIHCEDDPVPTPLSADNCECEGQLQVSPDCSSGFSCNSRATGGGYSITCDPGEIIEVDIRTWNWGCQPDNGACPDGGGFTLGCNDGEIQIPTQCVDTDTNPFGTCGCDAQVFVNEDCTQGFQCLDDADHPGDQDGCLYVCDGDQLLVPDFATGLFKCLENRDEQADCPGLYNIRCPDEALTELVPSELCECNGQLWVNSDCTSGMSCNDRAINGGLSITCNEGDIIEVDFRTWNWGCQPDNGACPDGGGFSLGCQDEDIGVIPASCVPAVENPFGRCGCDNQVFMNEECTEAFQCLDGAGYEGEQDGCFYRCEDDEILLPDFAGGLFKCVQGISDAFCPGVLETFCEDDPVDMPFTMDQCRCEGQLWVSPDCTEGFNCRSRFVNGGIPIECEEGETIHVGEHEGPIRLWSCESGNSGCPPTNGGYALGCEAKNVDTTTTTSTESSSEMSSESSSMSSSEMSSESSSMSSSEMSSESSSMSSSEMSSESSSQMSSSEPTTEDGGDQPPGGGGGASLATASPMALALACIAAFFDRR